MGGRRVGKREETSNIRNMRRREERRREEMRRDERIKYEKREKVKHV